MKFKVPEDQGFSLFGPSHTDNKKTYVDYISKNLEKGLPVGLTFDAGKVHKQFYGKGKTYAHVVSIIERKWKNGKYQFKIRDSRGKGCPAIDKFECDSDTGSYWVGDNDLVDISLWVTAAQEK